MGALCGRPPVKRVCVLGCTGSIGTTTFEVLRNLRRQDGDDAWQVTRVIPPAVITGQAAGTAAALAIEGGTSFHEVSVEMLQQRLADAGVIIHYPGAEGVAE